MKFSTRIDFDKTVGDLFDLVSDFDRLERVLSRQRATVTRLDPSAYSGVGLGWEVIFKWRGQRRVLRVEVTGCDRAERVSMRGLSDALELVIDLHTLALSRARSRLIFETDVRPRNMRTRLMLQTAKLAKGQLDRRYERRIADFVDQMVTA